MNREQFEEFKKPQEVGLVRASDFIGVDRTLLYGYTCTRETWHVYLKGGLIHVLVYTATGETVSHKKTEEWDPASLVPDKRVYPESTDPVLARALKSVVDVPYMGVFDDERYKVTRNLLFHGKTVD